MREKESLAPPKERIKRFIGQELKPAPKQAADPATDGQGEYVKVTIFPQVRYLKPDERRGSPSPMQPESFQFGKDHVRVDRVALCERTVSRKVGGRGFRYTCHVSWMAGGRRHEQSSIVWFDDFLEEWFVEVPKSRAPVDWDTATQVREDAPE